MKILLAVDSSLKSEQAIDELLRLNIPAKSKVRMITAIEIPVLVPPTPFHPGFGPFHSLQETLKRGADLRLQKIAAKMRDELSDKHCEVETRVLFGYPVQMILEETESWAADLLVIGSHLYSAWERWLIGSNSMSIAQEAHCDIYIARQPATVSILTHGAAFD